MSLPRLWWVGLVVAFAASSVVQVATPRTWSLAVAIALGTIAINRREESG